MRKFLLLVVICVLSSCTSKWEYKIVKVQGSTSSIYEANEFVISDDDLNMFGIDGWELVDVYTIVETSFPNFGSEEYVTGIRENTQTSSVNYVFKRRK